MPRILEPPAASRALQRANVRSLTSAAHLANRLAKQLAGADRDLAYQVKAAVCSALILDGTASVNGLRAFGILALDILSDPPSRLHIPFSHLQPDAQQLIRTQQTGTVRVLAPLAERLDSEQLDSLTGRFPKEGHRAA